jgi:hypothetical protein
VQYRLPAASTCTKPITQQQSSNHIPLKRLRSFDSTVFSPFFCTTQQIPRRAYVPARDPAERLDGPLRPALPGLQLGRGRISRSCPPQSLATPQERPVRVSTSYLCLNTSPTGQYYIQNVRLLVRSDGSTILNRMTGRVGPAIDGQPQQPVPSVRQGHTRHRDRALFGIEREAERSGVGRDVSRLRQADSLLTI